MPLDILGVSEDASQDQIKKAFLVMAKKYHPDVNPTKDASKKFSDINEAYETLSDAEKRAMYDQTGMSANEQDNITEQYNTSGFGFDPFDHLKKKQAMEREYEDIEKEFKEFFSMDFAYNKKDGDDKRGSIKGRDITGTIRVTFEEACKGSTKPFSFKKNVICKPCKGTGIDKNALPVKCEECKGSGSVDFGGVSTRKCSACSGEGEFL